MKPTLLYSAAFACLASFALANPLANANADISKRDTAAAMGALKGCSGSRTNGDHCSGRRLGPQNSFRNCKNRDGRCCAKNKDGTGGLDVGHGMGREDCGFCFSGKCKA
ncbi:hypothetical protein MGYG_03379 [Nannizzia gypsea CBS 118893]|uniref:Uncharacterized protein n=1 Tax=Arthroderma gypseum (strain ATCC MYA-4604 / CBS 118893) TaxID=535722 RepID=E4UNC7_ARTGP|nr:hypothetical protein MGYG_03379 [Nannizzia gypsea CBS 118893]EFR00377.1 hypothetical protein MGYG_03379 [Nannizzia gypsea CBS 118893]